MVRLTPEAKAREAIDAALAAAGWVVQDPDDLNLQAGLGVAAREFRMAEDHGRADYLLFVDGRAVGALEAKKAGHTLGGVEGQARKYGDGLPGHVEAPLRPLPFLYTSNGTETRFANRLDPEPRSRAVFAPHRPETLAEWLRAEPLSRWVGNWSPARADVIAESAATGFDAPATLRSRLRALPPAEIPGLWGNQVAAIRGLERSLAEDHPRALIQMATGSGKSLMAVASIYRLIKFGGARRVLFLVDRTNLGEQACNEFETYRTYDDQRKLTELYNVQLLRGNKIASSAKVVITTIQRLYSMLRGDAELDPQLEDGSDFAGPPLSGPIESVAYNPALPPEYFDVIFIDECHRSIYTLWRQVLEYFDAHLVGLTATPAKHTFGFFHKNLVMEYPHEQAVADGVNVDFDVYRIRTRITAEGSTIEAAPGVVLPYRERRSRATRWEAPDEDVTYTATQLDRDVVAKDQIRTIVRTLRDRLFSEIFPGRTHVPKTLVFAKDDSHAEDVVDIIREELGKGDDFCTKITYKSTGKSPRDLIQEFRTGYNPRIAVTVDMIATGTDVRPIEIVVFLRTVQSRVLYEQMKGRGVRVVGADELQAVTPDARAKTHFVLVDCVGVSESRMSDTRPLDQKRGVSFRALLQHVAQGGTDPDMASSLAARLARLDRQLGVKERARIEQAAPGTRIADLAHGIVDALDPDLQRESARAAHALPPDAEPSPQQVDAAAKALVRQAVAPLATQPKLRQLLEDLKKQFDQIIDEISQDELLEAGPAPAARERARHLVQSFEDYLAEHRDEIEALQFFYSVPHGKRLRFADIKALADTIGAPPRSWTPDRLWHAYQQLDADRVRGASGKRLLTDVVSLIRYALHQDPELLPWPERVRERFAGWMAQQRQTGKVFDPEQTGWLELMRDHVAQSLEIEVGDFELTPFVERGGLGRARRVFPGGELERVIGELNEVLAA